MAVLQPMPTDEEANGKEVEIMDWTSKFMNKGVAEFRYTCKSTDTGTGGERRTFTVSKEQQSTRKEGGKGGTQSKAHKRVKKEER